MNTIGDWVEVYKYSVGVCVYRVVSEKKNPIQGILSYISIELKIEELKRF